MEKWTKEERKAIGSRIKSLRKKRGLLQEDLANLIGLKVGTISKYEQGDRTPGIRQLMRIAEILECSIAELMTGDEEAPTAPVRQTESMETAATQNQQHVPDTTINQTTAARQDSSANQTTTTHQETPEPEEPAAVQQTNFDAFLQWLNLSSIKIIPEAEDSYLLQIGSKTFHLSEKELHQIMGFLKKQFLKILLEISRKKN